MCSRTPSVCGDCSRPAQAQTSQHSSMGKEGHLKSYLQLRRYGHLMASKPGRASFLQGWRLVDWWCFIAWRFEYTGSTSWSKWVIERKRGLEVWRKAGVDLEEVRVGVHVVKRYTHEIFKELMKIL